MSLGNSNIKQQVEFMIVQNRQLKKGILKQEKKLKSLKRTLEIMEASTTTSEVHTPRRNEAYKAPRLECPSAPIRIYRPSEDEDNKENVEPLIGSPRVRNEDRYFDIDFDSIFKLPSDILFPN